MITREDLVSQIQHLNQQEAQLRTTLVQVQGARQLAEHMLRQYDERAGKAHEMADDAPDVGAIPVMPLSPNNSVGRKAAKT